MARNSSEDARLFEGLNAEQERAVRITSGPLLVLAGAGTGKTLVIIRRIAHLLSQRIPAESILAVTFTRKSAGEMRDRVQKLLGISAPGVKICTFHSFGLQVLREHGHRLGLSPKVPIFGTTEQLGIIERILDEVDPEGQLSATGLLTRISAAKNRGITSEILLGRELDEDARRAVLVYTRYEAELRKHGALDLDDLILFPLKLLRDHARVRNYYLRRFRYILIDEYQDTNRGQYLLTRDLVGEERNVCVVGDDDQSIYRFRGAEVGNLLNFQTDYSGTKIVTLEQNYRCTESIVRLANAVIAKAKKRYPKRLISNIGPGQPVRWKAVAHGEAETKFIIEEIRRLAEVGVSYADIAILHRVQSEIRKLEAELKKQSIPYGRSASGVLAMTLHQAKGLEFPVVFLPAVEDGMLPHFRALQEGVEAVEEERRLFYVGITRAKRQLIITSAASRAGHGREPSRFLREVKETGVIQSE